MPDLGFSQLFMVAGEMPDFSIPDADQEFMGDPDDKKDQANHRKRLAQLEVQQQDKKVPALHCPFACMCYKHVQLACMHRTSALNQALPNLLCVSLLKHSSHSRCKQRFDATLFSIVIF